MGQLYMLYRVYDASGALLYVGATTNPGRRLADHSRIQPWWEEASDIKLERFDDWEALTKAETVAIQIERPRHNIAGGERGRFVPYKPRRTKGEGAFYRRSDGVWIGRVELPMAPDGKRRFMSVSSKDRMTALRKLESLKAAADHHADDR